MTKINIPCVLKFLDYHEIYSFQIKLATIIQGVKVIELIGSAPYNNALIYTGKKPKKSEIRKLALRDLGYDIY